MKKCKHDICKRDAAEGELGYCDRCIQLHTKECNYCQPYKTKIIMTDDIVAIYYKETKPLGFFERLSGKSRSFLNKIEKIEVKVK